MFSGCFSRCYYKYNILIWQASLQTESSISHLTVRILSKSRQLSRPAPEIRLHLLPIQKRIISSYDPPFHQKCRCSCHKRRCERSSTHHCHPSANCCRPYVHSRCHKIRFHHICKSGKSSYPKNPHMQMSLRHMLLRILHGWQKMEL
mgnify:CR=1 FL=1